MAENNSFAGRWSGFRATFARVLALGPLIAGVALSSQAGEAWAQSDDQLVVVHQDGPFGDLAFRTFGGPPFGYLEWGPPGHVDSLRFSPDGRSLAATDRFEGVRIFDGETPHRPAWLRPGTSGYALSWAPDSRRFAFDAHRDDADDVYVANRPFSMKAGAV